MIAPPSNASRAAGRERHRDRDGRGALDHAGDARRGAAKLETGVRVLSETVRAGPREGDIGMQLGEIAKANPAVAIGSYPFFDPQHGAYTKCGTARPRSTEARACEARGRGHARVSAASAIQIALAPSHGENRGSSRLGSANNFNSLSSQSALGSKIGPILLRGRIKSGMGHTHPPPVTRIRVLELLADR
jgi:hypothetical protein